MTLLSPCQELLHRVLQLALSCCLSGQRPVLWSVLLVLVKRVERLLVLHQSQDGHLWPSMSFENILGLQAMLLDDYESFVTEVEALSRSLVLPELPEDSSEDLTCVMPHINITSATL